MTMAEHREDDLIIARVELNCATRSCRLQMWYRANGMQRDLWLDPPTAAAIIVILERLAVQVECRSVEGGQSSG